MPPGYGLPEGKRETGASPVRSRHCKRRADGHDATKVIREGGRRAKKLKSGNLPVSGTGA